MRYTEARLARIAEEMLVDIEKDTIDFIPNFDATLKEPAVLPSRIPNLLINGGSGIAVGMATNIPPHNLREVCDAIISYIKNPKISVKQLMKHVKGPDFPTGGVIVGKAGIVSAYKTGRGKIVVRGRVEFEDDAIVIKEIPYMVNKAKLVEKIAELIKEGRLEEARTVRDESDREGIRIVIELRGNAQTALKKLYTFTNLQTTFGVINLALVNGEPRILNLKELIAEYVAHRREVLKRRTEHDLKKAEERLHIVEGLKKAVEDIDNVVGHVKSSKSPKDAKSKLIEKYGLSEIQAEAILQMRLQKLTGIEIESLDKEYDELVSRIAEYRIILSSLQRIDGIIISELEEIRKYGDNRRTELVADEEEISIEELIAAEENLLVITKGGFVKRMDIDAFKLQHRGGVGIVGMGLKEEDPPALLTVCNTHHRLLIFTDRKAYWMNAYEIPKQDRLGKGVSMRRFIGLAENERITSVLSVESFDAEALILTEDGFIKRIKLEEFENAKRAGILASAGKIVLARLCDGKEAIIATKNGYAVRFRIKDISRYGRSARGVRGIRLREGDAISWMAVVRGKGDIFTLTEKGYGKKTPVDLYRLTSKGSRGVINIKLNEKTGRVVYVEYVEGNEELLTFSRDGYVLKVAVKSIPHKGRNARGVAVSRKEVACATLLN
jgi:DNA gyrase subunit A